MTLTATLSRKRDSIQVAKCSARKIPDATANRIALLLNDKSSPTLLERVSIDKVIIAEKTSLHVAHTIPGAPAKRTNIEAQETLKTAINIST